MASAPPLPLLKTHYLTTTKMSLVGIDDIDLASFIRPALTTLRQPLRQIGQLAFDMLQQLLNDKAVTGTTEAVSLRLIKRVSSGKVLL